MRIFITGATGLIGRRLVVDRLERGDDVVVLSRDSGRAAKMFAAEVNRRVTVVRGNPAAPGKWQDSVAGCDAVIHLAGASIADHRWTASFKKTMFDSRIDSTHQVVQALEQCAEPHRPRTLISASAVGYYGDGGERELTEDAPPGADFLARMCVVWEAQARLAEPLGVRVVSLRSAVVLDERGGALERIIMPFRFFVGGPIGSGRQYLPWIHWRDEVGLIDFALTSPRVSGPLNAAAPQQVRYRDFAAIMGAILGRPSWLPVPKFALRIVLGEMAHSLTMSQRVTPAKARQLGYGFLYPEIEPALISVLRDHQESENPGSASGSTVPSSPMNVGPPPQLGAAPTPVGKQASMPAAPIRLIAIDVDGTLLRSDGSLAQGVIQACRAAERSGCVVVLATSRPPRAMRAIVQAIDLTSPTINYNGAVIWNPLDDRPQFHEPLAGELAKQIADDARQIEPEVLIGVEVLDRWFTDRVDPRFINEQNRHLAPDYIGPLDQIFAAPVTKINLLGMPERMPAVLDLVRARYWQSRQIALFLTDPALIQITHPLVDKGIALQRIARKLGAERDEVMAIGDAANDLGMIEWAGFGVAVANAYPAVLELADAVVPSNDEHGVAKAIQRFVLSR